MTFAELLEQRMKALGLTQAALKQTLGVDGAQVNRWLRKGQLPREQQWPDIAAALEVPLDRVVSVVTAQRMAPADQDLTIAALRGDLDLTPSERAEVEAKIKEVLARRDEE